MESISTRDPRVSAVQDKDQHWIVLDDPRTKNALDSSIIAGVMNAIENAPPGILVVTGRNGGFSTGGSLATVLELSEQAQEDLAGVASTIRTGGNLIEDLLVSSSTTVALIDGACAGAGLGIALACDYRLATHRSRFTTAYSKLGLTSDFGTYELMSRQIGKDAADELMKSSDTFGITRATELGLIDTLIERLDRKGVKKALKTLPPSDRKKRIKGMSAILDAEADLFARMLSKPETQMKIQKAIRKAERE